LAVLVQVSADGTESNSGQNEEDDDKDEEFNPRETGSNGLTG
jgi:hypothetical protein